ncbi:BTAD domain-containing putative transcriptional regulator [Microtetraspora malaysiensis]|uniref:BTAD domain-containing putative transcriptional regulator n=1 Tax=Microtetraspora malaysiensis TaxID=161358 RepID=UPI003D8D0653
MTKAFAVLGRLVRGLVVAVLLALVEAGVPAMLVRFAGWPFPRKAPTWEAVRQALMSSIPDEVLLKVLACPLWLLWAAFTIALVVEIWAAVRGVQVHVPLLGPLQTVAAGLIGSLAIAVLPIDVGSSSIPARPQVVPVAMKYEAASDPETIRISSPVALTALADRPVHVVKQGDSLWTIARRRLGDPLQWMKIWKLNTGHLQADGQVFTNPDLIRPGWRLRLPLLRRGSGDLPREKRATTRPVETPQPKPMPSSGALSEEGTGVGIELPSGSVVAMSVAAGVAAAYALARFQRRRRRVSPSIEEAAENVPEEPPALAVEAMRRAYRQSFRERGAEPPSDAELIRKSASALEIPGAVTLGTGEHGATVDVALAGLSLGMTGPGADDAVRAFVLDLLQQAGNLRTELIMSRQDVLLLTGIGVEELGAVPGLTVTASRDEAVDRLEEVRFTRRRLLAEREADDVGALRERDPGDVLPAVVLVASATVDVGSRAGVVLASGGGCGIGALMLGEWPPGTTCHVGDDHRVSSAEGPLAPRLVRAGLFHVTRGDLAAALRLLARVQGEDSQPLVEEAEPSSWEHPTPVWVRVLGKPAVWVKEQEHPLRIRGLKLWLLVYLALHPQGATKEAICEALWPGKPLGHEFHSLLRHLRHALEESTGLSGEPFIQLGDDETYRVDLKVIGFDLWDFHAAVKQARTAGDRTARTACLTRAADLCGGEIGAGISEEWVLDERYPLIVAQVDALTQLAEVVEGDDAERALELLDQARRLDPDTEDTWCRLIRLQVRLGRADQARQTGRLLRAHMQSLQVEPMPETQELLASLARSPARQG